MKNSKILENIVKAFDEKIDESENPLKMIEELFQSYKKVVNEVWDEAYHKGYEDGENAGYDSGYDQGKDAGYREGYNDGYDERCTEEDC